MDITAFLQYLEFEKRFSENTLAAYTKDMEQFSLFLSEHYGAEAPDQVTHRHIRAFMVDLLGKGNSPKTVNRKLSTLRAFFRFLARRGQVPIDPTLKVTGPKTPKRLPGAIRQEELERLFGEVDFPSGFEGSRDRLLLEVLYATGIRRAELIGLKVADVDLAAGHLLIRGKGRKERLVPISRQLADQVQAYLSEREGLPPMTAHLFLTGKGKEMYPKLAYNIVKRYLSLVSSSEQMGPHALRHSFATHLAENGAELNAIKELLGHASLASTQIYTHNTIARLKEVYQQAHPKAESEDMHHK